MGSSLWLLLSIGLAVEDIAIEIHLNTGSVLQLVQHVLHIRHNA